MFTSQTQAYFSLALLGSLALVAGSAVAQSHSGPERARSLDSLGDEIRRAMTEPRSQSPGEKGGTDGSKVEAPAQNGAVTGVVEVSKDQVKARSADNGKVIIGSLANEDDNGQCSSFWAIVTRSGRLAP